MTTRLPLREGGSRFLTFSNARAKKDIRSGKLRMSLIQVRLKPYGVVKLNTVDQAEGPFAPLTFTRQYNVFPAGRFLIGV